MRKGKRFAIAALVILAAITIWAVQKSARGPVYQDRCIADWVELALGEPIETEKRSSSDAAEILVHIGTPAVPFLAKAGLHDQSHQFNYLEYTRVASFCHRHPLIGALGLTSGVLKSANCAARHEKTRRILSNLGTNAEVAIPDVIKCLEHCPNLHYVSALELLDTLGEICSTNPMAIAYLSQRAQGNDSLCLRAAVLVYYATGQTNLLLETCQRLARTDPQQLFGHELFWLREDHSLNRHIVPLLAQLYHDPRLKQSILFELEARGSDAANVLQQLTPSQTNGPPAGGLSRNPDEK